MSGQRVDFTPTGKPVTHNYSAYTNHRCRCEVCTDDWRRFCQERRDKRAVQEPPRHGLSTTYTNWACRCSECCKAHTGARRESAARIARSDP